MTSVMTISELARRTGVLVPTIHYYRRLGLLPEPIVIAPNRFHYDHRHVEALAMIRLLREQRNLSLAAISDVLPDLLPKEDEEAFRPEMWDEVLAAYLHEAAGVDPAANLLAVAREAFVRSGYDGINIAELSEEAGMATGSFYRHFPTKEAAFVAAVRSISEVVAAHFRSLAAPISDAQATGALRPALDPLLPLLVEAATRERQGQGELKGVTDEVIATLTEAVEASLRPSERLVVRARGIVRSVMFDYLDGLLGFSRPD